MNYPPPLTDEQLDELIFNVKDWQLSHGSLLKIVNSDEENSVLAHSIGVSLFPTLFPRTLFDEALALQGVYNKLYAAVAEDEQWLHHTLKGLIELDILADTLWDIYLEVKREGYSQPLTLGIFRSDYMLHADADFPKSSKGVQIRQVEFNTVSCAGGVHGNRISEMHKYLNHTGAFHSLSSSPTDTSLTLEPSALPLNTALSTLVSGISAAHHAYGPPKSTITTATCVLMIVQPNNFNIADERPIEYSLFSQNPPIPVFRVHFGLEVLKHTHLTHSKELLYHPPTHAGPAMEVSVVYFRAGFEPHEYDEIGRDCRLHLERSRAIKCPSILSHLTTFKKVQQELVMPGVLEQFLSDEEASALRGTFVPMYPMDESESGLRARKLAMDVKKANGYVLKPSLEGGGHNVYGGEIPGVLTSLDEKEWASYVLMEKISPPNLENILISTQGIHEGRVVSELGVFGVCIWRRRETAESDGVKTVATAEMVEELQPSWSFKTKAKGVNEMSVVKGYGCFDSPALVNSNVFEAVVNGQGD